MGRPIEDLVGLKSYEEQQAKQNRERTALNDAGLDVAECLWGIERWNEESSPDPAPIYITLALRLQNSKRLREALKRALHNLDAAQKSVGDRDAGE